MNCLAFALRFWEQQPEYKLYYNTGHVINSKEPITCANYLPAEDFGYVYFSSSFAGLLDSYEEQLLKKYFDS